MHHFTPLGPSSPATDATARPVQPSVASSASSRWPIQSILDSAPGFLTAQSGKSQKPALGSHTHNLEAGGVDAGGSYPWPTGVRNQWTNAFPCVSWVKLAASSCRREHRCLWLWSTPHGAHLCVGSPSFPVSHSCSRGHMRR